MAPIARAKTDTAEAWLARLSSPDCGAQDHAEFERWLAAAADNPRRYADAERVHHLASALASDPGIAALARTARRETDASARRSRLWWWLLPTAVASLVAAAGLYRFGIGIGEPRGQAYATAVGEQRAVALADGSRMVIDTDTRLEVAFDDDARRVRLQRGRIHLDVAHDARRPLTVEAGEGRVRVTGTVFQVERDERGASVGLLKGRVEVTAGGASRTLQAGESIGYDRQGRLGELSALDVRASEGWKKGLLVLSDRRLDSLLAEMNRYSTTKLVLARPELGAIVISGVFRVDDQQALLDALHKGWNIQAVRTGRNEIRLAAPEP